MDRPLRLAAPILVAALALCACDRKPGPAPGAGQADTASDTVEPRLFVERLGRIDLFEREAAGLAGTRSGNPEVQAFAARMAEEHAAAAERLKASLAAASLELAPPAVMHPDEQGKLDALTQVGEADFDEAYMDGQIAAHQELVGLLRGYAEAGGTGALKDYAAGAADLEQAHLEAATALEDRLR